ncbi:hypothetical protein [Corynebacterium freiburgense]|uniref:hypothetical protein n=1 Tax=Corynebacterium freiburgense TaxID=556548 RepID=UPI0004145BD8|nr:hypothetical protein [Corynebacterium freiburgense]WJZ02680.1 hypothetical protein CFREI_06975 [Corynebacterium freiburgense]
MESRLAVYTPLQHGAVWLGGWLHGKVPYDHVADAFIALFGSMPSTELLREIRIHAEHASPSVRLALFGPGDPHGLPEAEALVIGNIVLSPALDTQGVTIAWNWREHTGNMHLPFYSASEAAVMLQEATNRAITSMEQFQRRSAHNSAQAREYVAQLQDRYSEPGLPADTDPRAVKLFAQANTVAAVIETMHNYIGDYNFDAELLSLLQHVRRARMAGVDQAVIAFSRG